MKKLLRAVVLLAIGSNACAIEPPPVLLIVHNNIGVETAEGTSGLLLLGIGAWANNSVNKQSAVKVARFNTTLGGLDFVAEASRALGCAGVGEPCADRAALTDVAQFELALAARPGRDGFIVELTPELVADQMLMRAVSHAVVLSEKKTGKDKKHRLEQGADYIAVCLHAPAGRARGAEENQPRGARTVLAEWRTAPHCERRAARTHRAELSARDARQRWRDSRKHAEGLEGAS